MGERDGDGRLTSAAADDALVRQPPPQVASFTVVVCRGAYWCSKDRFSAKRLYKIVKELSNAKREIIEKHNAFRSFLNISPFSVLNELIDFIVVHTSIELREFNYNGKRIVFTKEMMCKAFGVRSGSRPLELLTKSVQSNLRDRYKGGLTRLPIKAAVQMLKDHADTDEDSIIRTWDLLCCASVLHPGTNNMMCLKYLGSMDDPKKTHEFDWDGHILELVMYYIEKIQERKKKPLVLEAGQQLPEIDVDDKKKKKKNPFEFWISGPLPVIVIVYMDHLDIPKSQHVINPGLPRACFVTSDDFNFIVKLDLDVMRLNNKTVFGRRPFIDLSRTIYDTAPNNSTREEPEVNPSASLNEWLVFPTMEELEVPARLKHLYEKHKVLFAIQVASTLKSLGVGLKSMQAHHMASLLIDVEASNKDVEGPSIVFPSDTARDDESNVNIDSVPNELDDEEERVEDVDETETIAGAKEAADVQVDDAKRVADVQVDDAKEVDDVQVDDAKEDEIHGGAPADDDVLVSANACTDTHPDRPQTTVIIDSVRIVDGVDEEDDVSSPVRPPIPSPTRRQDIGPGYWDDFPKFDLWSQDSELGRIPDMPRQTHDHIVFSAEKRVVDSSKAPADLPEAAAPVLQQIRDAATADASEENASTGFQTFERRNRCKRARKDTVGPQGIKKWKVSQDVSDMYDKFVHNRCTLKTACQAKKKAIPYDCGYFSMMYMSHFNGKVMQDFDQNIPNFRKVLAAELIEERENNVDLLQIMENELQ
ncbi:unnamed protein product [Alopecurus aequalis]